MGLDLILDMYLLARAKLCWPAQDPTWRQVINRDLSVAALRYFVALRQRELAEGKLKLKRQHRAGAPVPAAGKGGRNQVRVLEGLAASGLRAIRYALEARCLWFWPLCCWVICLPRVSSHASGRGYTQVHGLRCDNC